MQRSIKTFIKNENGFIVAEYAILQFFVFLGMIFLLFLLFFLVYWVISMWMMSP